MPNVKTAQMELHPHDLRLVVDPGTLGFADTSALEQQPLPWIGQDRANRAAHFGLCMDQPDYNLFVLGEVGSGRSSLLRGVMQSVAARRPAPPDLVYLHNFDAPEWPNAMRLKPGAGRNFRQRMLDLTKSLQTDIPLCMAGQEYKTESERLSRAYKGEEAKAYNELDAFAEARHFTLYREAEGHLVFTLRDEKGRALTENEALALSKERRTEIDQAEQELRAEITRFTENIRPLQRVMNDSLIALRRQVVKPLLDTSVQKIRDALTPHALDVDKLLAYLEEVLLDLLKNLALFQASKDSEEDEGRIGALTEVLSRYRVNLVVDNHGLIGAPVIIEDNPVFRSLFGSIEYQAENDILVTDFSRIRAGSLLKAHGGFLQLHLRDLLVDDLVWEKLRRFLRSGRLQIEDPGITLSLITAVSLQPEAIDIRVKIVLIGSIEQYYALQEGDPEFARRFRVKVDFAESFLSDEDTRRSSAIFVAHTCKRLGLTHFSAGAVARLLEASHREAEDQSRQSAIFAQTEALVIESATVCSERSGALVDASDVEAALCARTRRHDYPEQRLQESFIENERLIVVNGEKIGEMNGLTQIDLGDYRFGFPVRVTARTFAGDEGLLNIEREVELSGPIHDKGVLILHSYLSALFAHLAPLALNASVVFEQEYQGVEGDSASCAEFCVLLSSLSGLAIRQGIAVTGAVNQHGQMLPVGGINEKIEGYFRVCEAAGLDGSQGVLIPNRNRRHLMLERKVVDAVAQNKFHIYSTELVGECMEILTGLPFGVINSEGEFPPDSVLGCAQKSLRNFRQACQVASRRRSA